MTTSRNHILCRNTAMWGVDFETPESRAHSIVPATEKDQDRNLRGNRQQVVSGNIKTTAASIQLVTVISNLLVHFFKSFQFCRFITTRV